MEKNSLTYIKNISLIGFSMLIFGNTYNFGNLVLYVFFWPIKKQYFHTNNNKKFCIILKSTRPMSYRNREYTSQPLIQPYSLRRSAGSPSIESLIETSKENSKSISASMMKFND